MIKFLTFYKVTLCFVLKFILIKGALKYGKTKLVMIGNGMAGLRTIEEILERSQSQFDITIIGKEPYPNYNRIMLSNILQKKMTVEDTIMNPYDWYQENNIELINNDPVEKVDKENKIVTTSKGIEVEYDIVFSLLDQKLLYYLYQVQIFLVSLDGEQLMIQIK